MVIAIIGNLHFLFRSSLSTSEMIEKLKPYLDSGDKLFVTEIVNNKQGG